MLTRTTSRASRNLHGTSSRSRLVNANGIKIDDADIKETAKEAARAQFAQYGMNNIPEEYIDNYATDMLKKREYIDSFVDRSIDRKGSPKRSRKW